MPRPRPIRRLIDGRPDDSGRKISRRLTGLMAPTIALANMAGATVILFLALYGVPLPDIEDTDAAIVANLIAFGTFLGLAVAVGVIWGYRRLAPMRRWLIEDRAPDDRELRITLRAPRRLLLVNGTLWATAVGVFFAVNVPFSVSVSAIVAFVIALGGVTTSTVVFLLSERLMRPVVARALSHRTPDRPISLGVVARSLSAWALGTAVPVVALALVGIASLSGLAVRETQLAITVLALGGIALAAGLFITWQAARSVADPVVSVREALMRVEKGDYEAEVPVFDASELGLLQAGFNRMAAGLREREELRDLFGRQVGEDVAKAALERGGDLGGESREVAVLFTDIIGSTALASERDPHEVVEALNQFFAVVIEVVERHDGWVNKFEGDAALAVFGAPVALEEYADCALAAARELAERLPEDLPALAAGIGVSAGTALAGNVGAESRFEYTVIGDPVNEAARLTELAKDEDGRVLASDAVIERAGEEERARWELGEARELRGRAEETRVARPLSSKAETQ